MTEHESECYKAWKEFKQVRNFAKEIPNAVWDFDIELPEKPKDYRSIANFGKPKSERKFPFYLDDYVNSIDDLEDDNPKKLNFIDQEWGRRRNGFWWYNGDKLEWINGHYYMTLQYWKIPVEDLGGASARPKFVDMHRDMNLGIWYLKNNPKFSGLAFIGARRSSKTVQGTANAYWDTTEKENAVCGIQSKSFTDSKKVLQKLVSSWSKLPEFLKPTDTGESTVSQVLRFSEPKRKSSKGKKKEYKDVLDSYIEAFPAKAEAMDGLRTTFQFIDEFGKNLECNVADLQKIAKVCCFAGASKIIGFSFWTTTVEEMEKKGGDNAKKVWDGSDINKLNKNGRTPTTMSRVFFPAYYGMFEAEEGKSFVDEWGYSKMQECVEWLDDEEENLDQDDLDDWRRKFPRTIDDCFRLKDSGNSYNKKHLVSQKIYNYKVENNPLVTGNFIWKDGIPFTEAEFKPNPEGRWQVAWMPKKEDRNCYKKVGIHLKPTRDFCRTGVDPYDHGIIKSGKGSDGAALTILKSHFTAPHINMGWVCKYISRPKSPNDFYNDIIKQCFFYSSPVLVENNKNGMINWMEAEGVYEFAMENPLERDEKFKRKKSKGYPMTSQYNRNALMDVTQAHIADHIGKSSPQDDYGFCFFDDLLDDWINFDPSNWTPHDLAVAAGVALIACKDTTQKIKIPKFTPKDFFPQYRVTGGNTVRF